MRLVQVQVLRVREFDSRPLLCFIRYGVVGNMSGSHPVASGSIPGIGLITERWSRVLLAQLAEHPLNSKQTSLCVCVCVSGALAQR